MTRRAATIFALALITVACGKKDEPQVAPTPAQAGGPGVDPNAAEQARIDSIARARADSIRAAAAAAASAREELTNEMAAMIHFDYDQYDIRTPDEPLLSRKAAIMRANPDLRIRIVGYADERGSDEYNLALGMRRAAAAKDHLSRLGVEAGRIETASLGEENPIDPRSNEAAWAANRRDEFTIIAGGQNMVSPGN